MVTPPGPWTKWESDKLTVDTTNESQEVSPFPAGDHKAHINRRAQNIANTRQNKNIKDKRSTKEVPPWNLLFKVGFRGTSFCYVIFCGPFFVSQIVWGTMYEPISFREFATV